MPEPHAHPVAPQTRPETSGAAAERAQAWVLVGPLLIGLLLVASLAASWPATARYIAALVAGAGALLLPRFGPHPQRHHRSRQAQARVDATTNATVPAQGQAAVVVVHGVSPQRRYGALSQMATGMQLHSKRYSVHPRGGLSQMPEVVFLHPTNRTKSLTPSDTEGVQLVVDLPNSSSHLVDIYEVYWSPLAQHVYAPAAVGRWAATVLLSAWSRLGGVSTAAQDKAKALFGRLRNTPGEIRRWVTWKTYWETGTLALLIVVLLAVGGLAFGYASRPVYQLAILTQPKVDLPADLARYATQPKVDPPAGATGPATPPTVGLPAGSTRPTTPPTNDLPAGSTRPTTPPTNDLPAGSTTTPPTADLPAGSTRPTTQPTIDLPSRSTRSAAQLRVDLPTGLTPAAPQPWPSVWTHPVTLIRLTVIYAAAERATVGYGLLILALLAGYVLVRLWHYGAATLQALFAWVRTVSNAAQANQRLHQPQPARQRSRYPQEQSALELFQRNLLWALFYLAVGLAIYTFVAAPDPVTSQSRWVAFAVAVILAWGGLVWRGFGSVVASTLGDIPAYTGTDENQTSFAAREQIQEKAAAVIGAVLDQYQGRPVVVVGHSLGSLVGRDALRRLYLSAQAEAPPGATVQMPDDLAFVTMGSPLRKTANYLETRDPTNTLAALNQSYDDFIFAPGLVQAGGVVPWYNAWYLTDIIADPLADRFPVFHDELIPWWPWSGASLVWTHGDYWRCPTFVDQVIRFAVEGPAAAAAAPAEKRVS